LTYLLVDVFLYRMKRGSSFLQDLFTSLVYVFAMTIRSSPPDISSIPTTTTVLTAAVAFAMQTTIAILFGFMSRTAGISG
jgi:hypothetical protein